MIRSRHRPRPATGVLVAAAALIASACGSSIELPGDAAPSTSEATTTAAPSTTAPASTTAAPATTAAPSTTAAPPTTSSTTTTSTTTTTTTTSAPTCPGPGGLPPDAADHTVAAGDLDGDGALDTIHGYRTGDPSAGGSWWLQVSFAAGGGTRLEVSSDFIPAGGVVPRDGVDLDGDGDDEFFATIGAGASAAIYGLFDVLGCALVQATLDGSPFGAPVGASVMYSSGLACIDLDTDGAYDHVVVYDASLLDPPEAGDFEITATYYTYADGVLTFAFADGGGANIGDPGFAAYSSLTCDPLP